MASNTSKLYYTENYCQTKHLHSPLRILHHHSIDSFLGGVQQLSLGIESRVRVNPSLFILSQSETARQIYCISEALKAEEVWKKLLSF